ncbi:MAG: UPF0182 family protein [Gemmatimonadota bacterium]
MFERFRHTLKGGRFLLGGFLLLLFLLFVGRWGVAIYVDLLWFASLELTEVYWTRALWEWGARLLAGGIAGALTWVNFRAVARSFQGLQVRRKFGDLEIQEQLPEAYIRWGMLLTAAFGAFWFATAVPQGSGLRGMLLLNGGAFGIEEPILGQDLGFYVFVLPVLQTIVTFGLVLVLFLAALAIAGYAATGAIVWSGGRVVVARAARVHLGMLASLALLLVGFRFYFAPFDLLLGGTSGVQGIFGYTDENARIPAYRMMAFLSLVTAAVVFWGARKGRLLPAGIGGAALALVGLAAVEVYPSLVQRFEVQPNELDREREYIREAVRFTRAGFGLEEMARSRLGYSFPDSESWSASLERLERLPVWTMGTLLPTFRQLEARFQYYEFHEIAFDRYESGGRLVPVALSVREIDPGGIPAPVSWQNLHLRERYIAGFGAVAGLAHRVTEEGRLPMFLTAIPPDYRQGEGVPEGMALARPWIFIGSRPQLYAVITPSEESFLDPSGAPGVPGVDYPRGIAMGSILRTLALAWRFQDANLLLASEVEAGSQLVFRRDVQERVRALAPFLHLPEAPYPVIAEGRIVWILEGFTLSRSYPLAQAHEIPGERPVAYLRNSVKATVDAVTGETRLYVADPNDPVLAAYRRAFPTLFRDLAELSEDVAEHLRYSRYLLDVQSTVLTRFHQDDPAVFHGQQDRWSLATELSSTEEPVPYDPQYTLMVLPGEEVESYVVSTLFVPQGRQNLASFLAARWSEAAGGELFLWDLPAEDQVRGPRQIEAMVEQDPVISQQFSLWRQGGSQVWTGHLHLVPVGRTLLYMEPVFLAADADAIPEVRRFLVSDGDRVAMEPTLAGSVLALASGIVGAPAEGIRSDEGAPPSFPMAATSEEALAALERAEAAARRGDWEGYGRGLEELRQILARLGTPPQP